MKNTKRFRKKWRWIKNIHRPFWLESKLDTAKFFLATPLPIIIIILYNIIIIFDPDFTVTQGGAAPSEIFEDWSYLSVSGIWIPLSFRSPRILNRPDSKYSGSVYIRVLSSRTRFTKYQRHYCLSWITINGILLFMCLNILKEQEQTVH